MIKVDKIDVWGIDHAIRGMRNPKKTWAKSDSQYIAEGKRYDDIKFKIGREDAGLMNRLYIAGSEHRKYLRQIFVSMDITAPLYWWKEFDQYKIGVTTDSCSTMHTITDKEFTFSDFSFEHIGEGLATDEYGACAERIIDVLNTARLDYIDSPPSDKKLFWWQIIQLLPSSYNQTRTVTMNYENVINMIHQRVGHKLDEWRKFVVILSELPYVEEVLNGIKA